MSADITTLSIKSLSVYPLGGGKPTDLYNSILAIDYFENILEPTISMEIMIFSSYSVFNTIPIRGGERVTMEIDTARGTFLYDLDNPLYVYKVSDLESSKQRETFVLHLTSREYFTNETSRCVKKYKDSPIDVHVKDILDNTLGTQNYLPENIESTITNYTFIGNMKKPFHILQWLGPKSISSVSGAKGKSGVGPNAKGKGTAGFFFYENKEGFNFRSIDNLVAGTKMGSSDSKGIPVYSYGGVIQSTENKPINAGEIIEYYLDKNIDLKKSLRVGMYSNYTYFYDMNTNVLSGYSYRLKDEVTTKLGRDDVVDTWGDRSSRVMFRISDHGVMDSSAGTEESGRDIVDVAKSYARFNLLFTQSLNILVPCNISLKVGDIIRCELPKKDGGKTTEYDDEISGNYLIREMRHHFSANQNTTSLKLMRDSYGDNLN